MSSSHAALDAETAAITSNAGRDALAPTSAAAASRASSQGPWRPASLAGRNSPAPAQSPTFRDTSDHGSSSHSGMTPLRSSGAGASASERHRPQPLAASATSSSLSSSPGAAWQSTSKRPTAPSSAPFSADRYNGSDQHAAASSSPVLGPFSSFSRSTSNSTPTHSTSSSGFSAPAQVAGLGSSSGPGLSTGVGIGSSTATSQKQPLNMEALAAKFADSKETKEKFAKLQLSPALSPTSLVDKERRAPMGSFAPSPSSSHITHIKVQRTASLNQNAHSTLIPKGSGGRLQPGHLAQTTDMRRTASHNNAFSSGLGMPVGPGSGSLDHGSHGNLNGNGSINSFSNGGQNHNGPNGALNSSSQLAPFSLSQMTRTPRRPSLNPPDHPAVGLQDQVSPMQTPLPSPLMADKHPLQHSWPHKMENSANYHLFKNGIKPMWEDPANANGGRWIVTLLSKRPELLDRCWMELAYALVGEQLDAGDDICGAVLSRRTKADRLAVWVRDRENVEAINGIGKRLIKLLDLASEKITLEFQITTDPRLTGVPKSYITLEAIKKELARESPSMLLTASYLSEADSTPSLSTDSVSVTPVSAVAPSPATPSGNGFEADRAAHERVEKQEGVSNSSTGLLISVNGEESMF
ncbi:hypothetical protein BGZ98_010153 [Dissophora globulifera]|nr:hypothetical protein BGZ98_010153 [Dissophora globulifera]